MFLGGPLTFFKGLRKRFVDSLDLTEKTAIFPKNSEYFVALGAAEYSKQAADPVDLSYAIENLKKTKPMKNSSNLRPLFNNEDEYQKFLNRHNKITFLPYFYCVSTDSINL